MTRGDASRLEEDLTRLETIVVGLKGRLAQAEVLPLTSGEEEGTFAGYAQAMLKSRNQLHKFLPARYFTDPAFDMLLDLFVATETRQTRSFKVTALASRVPPATAARYVEMMVKDGMILREADQQDGRRTLLSLSESAMTALCEWFSAISPVPLRRLPRE